MRLVRRRLSTALVLATSAARDPKGPGGEASPLSTLGLLRNALVAVGGILAYPRVCEVECHEREFI